MTKNLREAARWYSLAATQGLAESNYHLGLMKAHGRGFAQDLSGAAIHFQKVPRSLCTVPLVSRPVVTLVLSLTRSPPTSVGFSAVQNVFLLSMSESSRKKNRRGVGWVPYGTRRP